MTDLPPIGVRAVVEGADTYQTQLKNVQKATDAASKAIQGSASQTGAINKALDLVSKKMGGFGGQLAQFAQRAQGAQAELASLFGGLPSGTAALVAGAAAAAAFATAFVALGTRGAGLVGLSESFDRLNQAIGVDAVASLQKLRVASGGTVSDFELIRLANIALAGATGEFGREFGDKLPRILEIARVQARATGQSVDFLFQSLITGIKRGSPLLIDNTGLVLKVSEANEAYAASIGKTVEQLTAEEKQIAILNATLAAGQTAIDAFAGVQETAADKMARMNATITNILDTLAVGVQPAFGMWLDVLNRGLGMIQILTTAITPFISSLLEAGTAIFTGPITAIQALAEPVIKLTAFFLTFATVLLQPVLRAITTVFTTIGTAVQRVVNFVGGAFASIGLTFDTLALSFGVGAGAMIAAMGNGMLQAYNAVVAPVILFIATAIADFLVGQSPPPKGPLSQIDKGGAATMTAWMEGFAGVSLEPVASVAAAVEATLGNIGAMALPQVEARLGLLDQALSPFNNQLEIIKANFEAINTPAEQALDAIDRQLGKAQEALAAGEAGSAEKVRALDAQREMIEKAVEAQQMLVDQAQIQQALAKAQQAPERALLAIQQARLKALETKKTPEAKEAAKAAGKADAPTAEVAAGGGAGGFDMSLPSVADLVSGQSAVDQMGADLGTGFAAGFAGSINTDTLAAFQENQALISAQTDRIGQANIGTRIADAFSGIGAAVSVKLTEVTTVVNDWIGGITDPAREGSIPYAFNALAMGDYSALVDGLLIPFDNIAAGITQFLFDNFDPESLSGIVGTLTLLPTRIENALSELEDSFNESVLVPIQDTITNVGLAIAGFFVNEGEGTLKGYLDAGVAWFVALPQRIFDALANLGGIFFAVFVIPVVGGLNLAIEAIESFINSALSALGTLVGSLAGIASAVGLGDQLAEIQASLVGGINLPRISAPTAPAAQMPAARTGGLFGVRVHRGEQVMGMEAGSRMAVFPRDVTRNLELLASVFAQPLPMELAGAYAGSSNSQNTTYNQSFNMGTPASSGNAVQSIATLMAMKKRN